MHRSISIRSILIISAAALSLTACAGPNSTGATPIAGEGNITVPANYRQLITQHYAANGPDYKILTAEISAPGVWEGPLWGSRPIACARLKIEGPIIDQTFTTGFTFKDGRIADVFDPGAYNPAAGGALAGAIRDAYSCGKLTYAAFPEVMKPAKKRKSER